MEKSQDEPRRPSALDLLKKQADTQPVRESPEVARARMIVELDQAMRGIDKYLAEVVSQVNALEPAVDSAYELLFIGRIPKVQLSNGFVDSRPKRIDGRDVCESLSVTYKARPAAPVGISLFGEEIARCTEHLKNLRLEYTVDVEQKNDFGQARRAKVSASAGGSIGCIINLRADYSSFTVGVELINAGRFGRREARLAVAQLKTTADDLARYILGADSDFEKVMAAAKTAGAPPSPR
jgi:hypothetical protein